MDKETTELMFSSKSNEWATPDDFFQKLDRLYGPFTLDPAATDQNHKVSKYFDISVDGLKQDWSNNYVFCNPPYGKEIANWVEKGYNEGQKNNTCVVMLIPSRTDTKYWHEWVMKADEILFVKGRIKFGNSKTGAPFPSAVVVFRKTQYNFPRIGVL